MKGFNAGTDDYIVKPFDPVELVLRVKSLLKRYKICLTNVIQLGTVTINMDNLTVSSVEEIVCLKRKSVNFSHARRVSWSHFYRSQLIEKIWGIDYEGDDRTVDVHIKRLRERLNPFPHY